MYIYFCNYCINEVLVSYIWGEHGKMFIIVQNSSKQTPEEKTSIITSLSIHIPLFRDYAY